MIEPSPLTLGTASIGMVYGVTNPKVAMTLRNAEAILDRAWQAGITCFDTAPAYGCAEKRIGDWTRLRSVEPVIVTKLPPLTDTPDADISAKIKNAVTASTAALSCSYIHGYLTHGATDYFRPAVREALECLSVEGLIGAYGPSVYTSDDVERALVVGPPALIQVPVSALDRRMIISGALNSCRNAGVCVFARSIFLQGVILAGPNNIPQGLSGLEAPVVALTNIAHSLGISVASLALRYVRHVSGISSMVVGVYSVRQLDELIDAQCAPSLRPGTLSAIEHAAAAIPHELLDPRRWPH